MYSLTFRVRVATPPQYGRNGTASLQIMSRRQQAAGTLMLTLARGAFAGMRSACGGPGGLPPGSATHFWCCHNNATSAPIANPPNSAQLGGIPYHSPVSPKSHPGPCNSVGMRPRTDTQTHKHTVTQTHVTTIHFASSTTHAKCNDQLTNF